MKTKIEDIVLIICGACAIVITIAFIVFSIAYLKQPVYNQYDVNHDGEVNSLDATAILIAYAEYLVNL
jgi:hypothetical protein